LIVRHRLVTDPGTPGNEKASDQRRHTSQTPFCTADGAGNALSGLQSMPPYCDAVPGKPDNR
jgi:hypothetical protein